VYRVRNLVPLLANYSFLCRHVLGIKAGYAVQKVHLGFFDAEDRAKIEVKVRRGY
jgi:hypothetical protein